MRLQHLGEGEAGVVAARPFSRSNCPYSASSPVSIGTRLGNAVDSASIFAAEGTASAFTQATPGFSPTMRAMVGTLMCTPVDAG
ncbi:MAG: hypothetical protein R3E41_06030 [Burkholderiaceae bacterium]